MRNFAISLFAGAFSGLWLGANRGGRESAALAELTAAVGIGCCDLCSVGADGLDGWFLQRTRCSVRSIDLAGELRPGEPRSPQRRAVGGGRPDRRHGGSD